MLREWEEAEDTGHKVSLVSLCRRRSQRELLLVISSSLPHHRHHFHHCCRDPQPSPCLSFFSGRTEANWGDTKLLFQLERSQFYNGKFDKLQVWVFDKEILRRKNLLGNVCVSLAGVNVSDPTQTILLRTTYYISTVNNVFASGA